MYSFDVMKKKDDRCAMQRQQLQRVYQFDVEDRETDLFEEIIDQLCNTMEATQ